MPIFIILIIIGILVVCFAIQLIYWYFGCLRFIRRLTPHSLPLTPKSLPAVSVIICARNEAENLNKNLPLILEQNYPVFEVIAVDDCSYDNTLGVLYEFAKTNNKIKIIELKEDELRNRGKKLALTLAIKKTQYEYLVFTDADCQPASKEWLSNMIKLYDDKTEIVLGYGAYAKKKGVLNKLIRMDTFRIGLQYLSFAAAGVAYMGIGRNLSYRKSLFLKQKGFFPHTHVPSGDDDLFVNNAATRFNTKIALTAECITYSEPKKSFAAWLNQKRRHVSTFKYYKPSSKILMRTLTASQYLFWLAAIAAFILTPYPLSLIPCFIVLSYLVFQLIIYHRTMKYMRESDLFVHSLLLEWFILFIFYPAVAISNLIFKKVKWKI